MNLNSSKPCSLQPNSRKRIFIVEDHPVFERGLTNLVESEPGLQVCGHAASFANALGQLRRIQADAAILDVAIGGANGLELVKYLRAEHPNMALLVLSVHDEMIYGPRALRAGALGYVMKCESTDILLRAIHDVLAGKVFVSPTLGRDVLYRIVYHNQADGKSKICSLSDRELEVLALVGEGMTTRNIAEKLHISAKTVECHRLHAKEKLGLADAPELIHFAVRWTAEQKGAQ